MPKKAQVPCQHPGCPNLCDMGERYCEVHKAEHPSEFIDRRKAWTHEGSGASRGYNSKWQKARESYLAAHPLCVECMKSGKYTKGTVVDHIVPHKGNKELFWNRQNWQTLCKECHDRKTLSKDVRRGKNAKPPVYDYPWRREKEDGQ